MKTILITGSTDGVGKLTALKLAKDGHQLLLHGRNSEKLRKTISTISETSSNDKISGFVSDLSDFHSLKKMITKISHEFRTLDVLINNAGVFKSTVAQNHNKLDMRFAVNYVAPYLLTNGCIHLLKQSAAPRVINLSSAAQSPVSIEALQGKEKLTEAEAYAQSKLALTMWSFYLAQQHIDINTIAVNTGSLLNTKMVQEAYGQSWSSADKGANILYDLAISDKYASSSGKYFDNDKDSFNKAHADAYDQEKITSLLHETQKILRSS